MSLRSQIIVNSVAAVCLIAYMVASGMLYTQKTEALICQKLTIQIRDSAHIRFITPEIATKLLDSARVNPIGRNIRTVALNRIEYLIKRNPYVDSVEAYADMDGNCTIEITQKKPLIRITTTTGYDFLIDSLRNILPPSTDFTPDIPIITGDLTFDFPTTFFGPLTEKKLPQDNVFLENLINFVQHISSDDLLSALVTQIWIGKQRNIELIPRLSNQTIIIGTLQNYPEKLLQLKKFYTQTFKNGWWKNARKIDVQYKNQILITNTIHANDTIPLAT